MKKPTKKKLKQMLFTALTGIMISGPVLSNASMAVQAAPVQSANINSILTTEGLNPTEMLEVYQNSKYATVSENADGTFDIEISDANLLSFLKENGVDVSELEQDKAFVNELSRAAGSTGIKNLNILNGNVDIYLSAGTVNSIIGASTATAINIILVLIPGGVAFTPVVKTIVAAMVKQISAQFNKDGRIIKVRGFTSWSMVKQ